MRHFLRSLSRVVLPYKLREQLHFRLLPGDYFILRKSAILYGEDNLFTLNSPTFMQDPAFLRAYALGEQTGSWNGTEVRWRAYVACWAAQQAAKLPGDFVECGVNRGGLARAIIDYVGFEHLDKQFYLVDNFTGLVPEYLNKAELDKQLLELYAYYQNNSKDATARTFAPFSNVRVIQGNVPDVLADVPTKSVAFISLDMNCTMPEIKAAEFFWDQMVPGGILLLDDYTQPMHSEQQLAFDSFAKERGTSILALPTGQGILFKLPVGN